MLDATNDGTPLGPHATLIGQQLGLRFLKDHRRLANFQVAHYPACILTLAHIFQSEQDAVGGLERSSGGRMDAPSCIMAPSRA